MTNSISADNDTELAGIRPATSLLSSNDELLAGIRVTRAQFAKMMECSRQAVTDWVQSGRITVGADGRFDPCKAVADLLRTGDPSRLRAKVLQPMINELTTYRVRIAELEACVVRLSTENEQLRREKKALADDLEFETGASAEFGDLFDELICQLKAFWPALVALENGEGARVVAGWLESALESGAQNIEPMIAAPSCQISDQF